MAKHAYLIVANANFKVVEACIRLIDDPRNDIYLLLDAKARVSGEQKKALTAVLAHSPLFFYEEVVNWAGYSQISATLCLMEEALSSGVEYSYLHFMQGSDLPIKSQDSIHKYFEENAGYEFVSVEKSRTAMAQNKSWYRHYFCHNRYFRTKKVVKYLNFGLVKLQKMLHIRKNKDIALYQGSALFSITAPCAMFVLSKKEEIHRRFRYSLAADEVFLQTILMASEYAAKIKSIECETSENARLIDRTRPDGKNSPHIWRSEELSTLISDCPDKMFARKFDERVDFQVVEEIVKLLLGEEENE